MMKEGKEEGGCVEGVEQEWRRMMDALLARLWYTVCVYNAVVPIWCRVVLRAVRG